MGSPRPSRSGSKVGIHVLAAYHPSELTVFWLGIATALLVGFCTWAVWTDIRQRRIPNALTLGALTTGILLRAPSGVETVGIGLLSVGIAFCFGLFFYLIGGLGAGDVKLMAGLASYFDPGGLLIGLGVMAGVGVIMALVAVIRVRRVGATFRNLFGFFLTFGRDSFKGWKGEGPAVSLQSAGKSGVTTPYAVAIASGAIAAWFLPLIG